VGVATGLHAFIVMDLCMNSGENNQGRINKVPRYQQWSKLQINNSDMKCTKNKEAPFVTINANETKCQHWHLIVQSAVVTLFTHCSWSSPFTIHESVHGHQKHCSIHS